MHAAVSVHMLRVSLRFGLCLSWRIVGQGGQRATAERTDYEEEGDNDARAPLHGGAALAIAVPGNPHGNLPGCPHAGLIAGALSTSTTSSRAFPPRIHPCQDCTPHGGAIHRQEGWGW